MKLQQSVKSPVFSWPSKTFDKSKRPNQRDKGNAKLKRKVH